MTKSAWHCPTAASTGRRRAPDRSGPARPWEPRRPKRSRLDLAGDPTQDGAALDRGFLAPNACDGWAEETPDAVTLHHVDGRVATFARLRDEGRRMADGLRRLGVGQGTHVGTFLANDLDAHRLMVALGWLRAVEVPFNDALRGHLLHHALDLADVTVLVTTGSLVHRVEEVADRVPPLETVVLLDPDADASHAGVAGPEYHDTAAPLFTSGTTGPSKASVTPWAVVHQFWSFPPEDLLAPGEGLFCSLPLFHNSGRAAFNYTLVHGALLITRERFSATHLWQDVRRTDASVLALVGPLTSLVHAADPRPDDADNPVRTVVCGPMIPEIEEFERRFDVRVITCYGQTESGGAGRTSPPTRSRRWSASTRAWGSARRFPCPAPTATTSAWYSWWPRIPRRSTRRR